MRTHRDRFHRDMHVGLHSIVSPAVQAYILLRLGDFFSKILQCFTCFMFCPADFLHSSTLQKPQVSFLVVQISEAYSTTLHIKCYYHPYLPWSVYFSSQKFSPFENASFPIAILLLIYLWHMASVVIMLPT